MSVFWCVKPIECLTKYMPSILNKHRQNTCFHTVMPPVSVNKAGNSSPSVRLLDVTPYSFTIVSADFQLHAAAMKSPHYFSTTQSVKNAHNFRTSARKYCLGVWHCCESKLLALGPCWSHVLEIGISLLVFLFDRFGVSTSIDHTFVAVGLRV